MGMKTMTPHLKITLTLLLTSTLPAMSFDALIAMGKEAYVRGDYRAASDHLRKAKQMADPSEGAALAAANLASTDLALGRAAAAVAGYREALRSSEARGERDPLFRLILRQLADALHQLGEHAEARQHLDRLARLLERDGTPDADALARLRMSMANSEIAFGQSAKAESLYRQVLAGPSKDLGIRAAALDGLGESSLTRGKTADAEKAFAQALSLWTSLGQPVRAASTANRLGIRWLTERKPRRALPYLRQALAVFEAKGINGVWLVSTLNNLGQAHRFAGDTKEALHYYARAIETAKRDLGADHSMAAAIAVNVGDFALSRKKYDEAESHLRRALHIDERRLGHDHPDVARDLARLASLHLKQKQYSAANAELGDALAILDRCGAAVTAEHAGWFELRAGLLRGAENYAEAARLEAEAMRIRVKLALR
jgi:tetratricopeptide (TPR) repeat protein